MGTTLSSPYAEQLDFVAIFCYHGDMQQKIQAIYENGVLKPLEPLNLADHEQVSLTVQSGESADWLDHDALEWAQAEGDDTTSLEEVRRRLASISGSMAETVIADRGEY